jgi:hypothetical protein
MGIFLVLLYAEATDETTRRTCTSTFGGNTTEESAFTFSGNNGATIASLFFAVTVNFLLCKIDIKIISLTNGREGIQYIIAFIRRGFGVYCRAFGFL